MKRFLALLLTAVMLVSACLSSALAAEGCVHDWEKSYSKHPTCKEEGYGVYICKKCGASGNRFTEPALGHNYGAWHVETEPTCTEDGMEVCNCKRCGQRWDRKLDALGHDWGEWYRIEDPTPEHDGRDERDCRRCGKQEFRLVPYEAPVNPGTPVLTLAVTQTPDTAEFVPAQAVSYSWTVTNSGDGACYFASLVVKCENENGAVFQITLDKSRLTSDPSGFMAAEGGAATGSVAWFMQEMAGDNWTITMQAFGSDAATGTGGEYSTNEVTFHYTRPAGPQGAASLELTGTPGFTDPVPPIDCSLPIALNVTNTGDVQLTGIRIYVTVSDLEGGPYTLTDHLFYEDAAGTLDPAACVNTTYTQAVQQNLRYLAPLHLTYVAKATAPDGSEVVSNVWSCEVNTFGVEAALDLECVSSPAGAPAVAGTVIPVELKITNNSESAVSLDWLTVYDAGFVDERNEYFTGVYDGVDTDYFTIGSSITVPMEITVTEDDLAAGFAIRRSSAVGEVWVPYEENEYLTGYAFTNEVVIVIPLVSEETPLLSVYKEISGAPASGSAYEVGEKIEYFIHVTNVSDQPLYDILVCDPLHIAYDGAADMDFIDVLQPNETVVVSFSYLVDEYDAHIGYVDNQAYCDFATEDDGEKQRAYSNFCTAEVAHSEPQLTIYKIEITTPDPELGYYKVNDVIGYYVWVENNTEHAFYEVKLYDSLNDGIPTLMVQTSVLEAGDHFGGYYYYTVQAEDIGYYIKNEGYATFRNLYRVYGSVVSDPVYSPTADNPIIPPDNPNHPPHEDGEPDSCRLTIEGLCAEGAMYDQYICGAHQPYALRAAEAATVEEAVTIWQEALDALYDECMLSCHNGTERAVVLNEKVTFQAYVTAYAEALTASGMPANEVIASVNALMQRQCTEVCYVVHNAPEARPDSYIGADRTLTAATTAACAVDVYRQTGSHDYYQQNRCAAHASAEAAVLQQLDRCTDSARTLNVWQRAIRIWYTELTTLASAAPRGDEAAFDAQVTAHSSFLRLFYSEDVSCELITYMLRDRVNDICR